METKQIMSLALAIAIGALVFSAALIPAISMATDTEDTLTNKGYFKMSYFDSSDSHTISWTYENPSTLTVDGEDMEIGFKVKNSNVTIVADTNWLLRYYTDGNGAGRAIRYIPSTGNTVDALSDSTHTISLALSGGTLSGTIAGTSVSSTYTEAYVISEDGEYVMKNANEPAFIKGDSQIFGFGMTALNTSTGVQPSPGTGFKFTGDYDDGVTGSVWRGSVNTSITDINVNVTPVNGYVDLYTFESITATAELTETVSEETVVTETELTYNYVILPAEVTAELAIHADGPTRAILGMIPIIAVLGLLIGIVTIGYIKFRN